MRSRERQIQVVTWWGDTMVSSELLRPGEATRPIAPHLRVEVREVDPPDPVPRPRANTGGFWGYVGVAAIAILGIMALVVGSGWSLGFDAGGAPGGWFSGSVPVVAVVPELEPEAKSEPKSPQRESCLSREIPAAIPEVGSGTGPGYCGGCRNVPPPPLPFLKFGAGSAAGGLDKEVVRRIIRRSINKLRGCYRRLLDKTPGADAASVLNFEIAPSGEVSSSRATGDPVLATCVAGTVRSIRFPAGATATTVRYPLFFRPTILRH